MKRFSSREGYAAFEDALPTSIFMFEVFTLHTNDKILVRRLQERKIFTAIVSNSDSRSRKYERKSFF